MTNTKLQALRKQLVDKYEDDTLPMTITEKVVFLQALETYADEVRRETLDRAFDWIWDGWNLDLANKDRAKEHFLQTHSPASPKDGEKI